MTDFKRFADSLDNRYLVSGLKLDLITNAISQINREFQKSIGEQGMLGASSLRAAQNQAALLTATFKSFSADAAKAITQDISGALNKVAVTAGGTMEDVRKTLAATPFLSLSISADERRRISAEILDFQKNFRRAGISKDFGGVAGQFLSGKVSAMDLVSTGSPMESMLGLELMKRGSGPGVIYNQNQRTQLLKAVLEDPAIKAQLQKMAVETAGYKIFLEDINTQLFNPETGLFGPLRKVVDSAGRETTSFDETNKLIQQIFGREGLIFTFFAEIGKVFKIQDPLVLLVDVIEFITCQIKALTDFTKTPLFSGFVKFFKDTFEVVFGIFDNIYKEVTSGSFSAENIKSTIHDIGDGVRKFLQFIGQSIRKVDITETSITGTIGEEVGKTLGILVKELLMTLINKIPQITSTILPAINNGINSFLTELFGPVFGKIVKMLLSFMPGPIGMIARASNITDYTGGQGWGGLIGAAGAAFLPHMLIGRGGSSGKIGGILGGLRSINKFRNAEFDSVYETTSGVDSRISRFLNRFNPTARDIDVRLARSRFYDRRFLHGQSSDLPMTPIIMDQWGPAGPSRRWPLYGGGQWGGGAASGHWIWGGTGPNDPGSMGAFTGFPYSPGSSFGPLNSSSQIPRSTAYQDLRARASTTSYDQRMEEIRRRNKLRDLRDKWHLADSGLDTVKSGRAYFGELASLGLADEADLDLLSYFRERHAEEKERLNLKTKGSRFSRKMRVFRRGISRGWKNLPGIGKGATMAGAGLGAIGLASLAFPKGANAGELGEETTAATQSVLNTVADMAMLFPGWGMAIGLTLKAGAALMDRSTREAIMQFGRNIMDGFATTASNFLNWIGSQFQGLMNGLGSLLGNIGKALTGTNSQGNSNIPIIGWAQGIYNGAVNLVRGVHYDGLNSTGPALALEARMSGHRPMVVNSSEFVIPKGGMATLSGIVEERVRRSVSTDGNISPTFHVTVQVNNPVMLGANKELVNSLRQPILDVIEEAWQEVSSGTIRRPSVVG
jgi:hypothetical protein